MGLNYPIYLFTLHGFLNVKCIFKHIKKLGNLYIYASIIFVYSIYRIKSNEVFEFSLA